MGSTQSCSGDDAVKMTKDCRVDNPDIWWKIRLATWNALMLNGTVTSLVREFGKYKGRQPKLAVLGQIVKSPI